MATPAELAAIEAKAAAIAASGISSTSVNGRSVTVADPLKILEAGRRQRKTSNAWGRVRKSSNVVVPPGTTGEDCV